MTTLYADGRTAAAVGDQVDGCDPDGCETFGGYVYEVDQDEKRIGVVYLRTSRESDKDSGRPTVTVNQGQLSLTLDWFTAPASGFTPSGQAGPPEDDESAPAPEQTPAAPPIAGSSAPPPAAPAAPPAAAPAGKPAAPAGKPAAKDEPHTRPPSTGKK